MGKRKKVKIQMPSSSAGIPRYEGNYRPKGGRIGWEPVLFLGFILLAIILIWGKLSSGI